MTAIHPFPAKPPDHSHYELIGDAIASMVKAYRYKIAALDFAQSISEYALQSGDAYLAQMAQTFQEQMRRLK